MNDQRRSASVASLAVREGPEASGAYGLGWNMLD